MICGRLGAISENSSYTNVSCTFYKHKHDRYKNVFSLLFVILVQSLSPLFLAVVFFFFALVCLFDCSFFLFLLIFALRLL